MTKAENHFKIKEGLRLTVHHMKMYKSWLKDDYSTQVKDRFNPIWQDAINNAYYTQIAYSIMETLYARS